MASAGVNIAVNKNQYKSPPAAYASGSGKPSVTTALQANPSLDFYKPSLNFSHRPEPSQRLGLLGLSHA